MKRIAGMLAAALLLAAPAARAAPPTTPPPTTDVAAGRALAFARGKGNCLACHVIAGGELPGNIGPPLRDVKTLVPDRQQLYAIIYDETTRNPQTIMPPFGRDLILTPKQIHQIIDFLETQ